MLGAPFRSLLWLKGNATFYLAMISINGGLKTCASQRCRNNCLTVEMEQELPTTTIKPDRALQAIIEYKGILADAAKSLGMSRTNLVRTAQNSSKYRRDRPRRPDDKAELAESGMFSTYPNLRSGLFCKRRITP
jgi:hypothetical protein